MAFQVPITFGGVGVTDAEFVQRAHAQGYAVHVWLSGQREAPDVYEQLLDWNVDGVMAAEPTVAGAGALRCATWCVRSPRA